MKTKNLLLLTVAMFAVFLLPQNIYSQVTATADSVTFDNDAVGGPPADVEFIDVTGNDWTIDDGSQSGDPQSSGYSGVSGNNYLIALDGGENGTYESFTYTVSTLAFSNVKLRWGAYREPNFPTITLEYSLDNSAWTAITFTDVAASGTGNLTGDGTWALISDISLPDAVSNKNTVYFRWSFTDDGAPGSTAGGLALYLFDDIKFFGTVNTYFSKSSGNLDDLNTWGTNFDGTGSTPTSFTASAITYEIVNNPSATISSNWTVSGAGSKVRVGDLSTTPSINFTIPSTSVFTGTVDVAANGTLTIQNSTIPTLGTLATNTTSPAAAGSTIDYAMSGTFTIPTSPISYHNLSISGSGTKTLGAANYSIYGTLNVSTGTLTLQNSTLRSLSLYGPYTGSGVLSSTSSWINVNGSGTFGTLAFASGSSTLSKLIVSRPSTTVTLGSSLTVTTTCTFSGANTILDLNGNTLTLNSASTFSNSATVRGSNTSSIKFSGTFSGSFLMDQTSSSTQSLSNLTLNKSSATLTLGNTLNIIDSICPTLGTINTGGNLKLIADQSTVGHAGRIGKVGGTLSGNVTSQVYHKPNTNNTDWRLMGVAGISNATFSSWNSQFPMTCPTCPYTNAGGVAFSSITMYDEPTGNYPDITYSSNITPGKGYWVYLGSSSAGTGSAPYLISVSGTAQTGNVNSSLTSSGSGSYQGYNLVANPYASPISFAKLKTNNAAIDNGWYTYSPAYGDNAAYVGGISTPAYSHGGAGIDDVIPAGMGFFVHVGSAATLTFSEDIKTSGNNEVLLRQENPDAIQSNIQYFRMQVSGHNMTNETVLRFEPTSTPTFNGDFDLYDQGPGTPGWLQISTLSAGMAYTIKAWPQLNQNMSIPITITCATTGQYQFLATDLQNMPGGVCMTLHDKYTGQDHNILNGAFNLTINDTETVSRFVLNITVSPLDITTNAIQATCPNNSNGYITAVGNNSGPWNYTWKDSNGNIVKTSTNKATADTLNDLDNGVYTVDINTVGACDDAVQTFTLTAPSAPSSVFTESASQVNVGDNEAFSNNSTNADAYVWNFGDGSISGMQNPTYVYNNAGTYTVTLYAINSACNDTVSSTQTIEVDANTTGISKNNSGNPLISQDAGGHYIQFNYPTQTKINMMVTNILGQIILNNASLNVVNDKIYINVNDYKTQVLYVTITNLSNNQQSTYKFVNE